MTDLFIDFILIGIAGALLGLFYRNCLKAKGMALNCLYDKWLSKWAEFPDVLSENNCVPKKMDIIKARIAYPLGYCIYCSTFWITVILCIIYLTSWVNLPKWEDMVLGVVMAIGVQHLIICIITKYLIHKHPDLGNFTNINL